MLYVMLLGVTYSLYTMGAGLWSHYLFTSPKCR